MLYKVRMKYFNGRGYCYGIIDAQFPNFNLVWEMINIVKTDKVNGTKFYKMNLAHEDENNEYFERTHIMYTTCDGARRALKRSDYLHEGNRRLVLKVNGDADDPHDAIHVLIIIEAVEDVDF